MKKRGKVSATETIISFTLFVGFLVFILAYLNPLKQDVSDTLFNILEAGLKNKAGVVLSEWPVSVNNSNVTKKCFKIPIGSDQLREGFTENISVLDTDGFLLQSNISEGYYCINKSFYSANRLYRLIRSNDIETVRNLDCSQCTTLVAGQGQYLWSSLRNERIYSYKKLLELNNSYYNDYTALKEQIKYPINYDFSMIVLLDEMNITMSREIPAGAEIRVRRIDTKILKDNRKVFATILLYKWP